MRFGSRISLLVALVFGATAAFLVRGLIQDMGAGKESARTIVVAKAGIAPGMALGRENLREVPWHASETLDGSFGTIAELTRDGRRLALATLQRNEPVLASRITAPNQRATLSTQLEDGMRAVSVRVDEVRGVAGFVLPGDRVDLVLTRGENGGADQNAFADMLLQNAKVLAVDQVATEGQDKPTVARAVTLELTAQQAQRVVLAQGIGRISLVLRQSNGGDDKATARVTAQDLGAADPSERDRFAEMEKRLADMKQAADAARAESEHQAAQRLAETEARIRGEMMRTPALPAAIVAPAARPASPSSVVNVIRNGSKTEQYTVASER
ncbi:Flp pilus assembly protein CpaB [Methylobacterium trifolii]|uniref:Flp pilus assembly protein RcpC/CpaB domain-containing protein n=1 Tax=Methylobacterium trifolii TaxID=1003092 RepID=A0ABQ4U170_9HYPH|nr:Flp pilus assembly protein CpaB [Methylobacterium trifolii]GJE60038.1 hypothetical protein MPOCJGCO_2147 [Methylobacterium trifolii]